MKQLFSLIRLTGIFCLLIVSGTLNSTDAKSKTGASINSNAYHSFGPAKSQYVKYQQGKVIVKFKREELSLHKNMTVQSFSNQQALMATMESFGVKDVKKIFAEEKAPMHADKVDLSTIYELSFDENVDPWLLAAKLARDNNVEYAEPRILYELCYTPNDSLFSEQYHLDLIEAEKAWDITQGSENVVIAIVDNGVDWRHPDLVDNIWQNLGEDADGDGHTIEFNGSYWDLDPGDLNGIDDDDFDGDPTTFIDDLVGWDVSNDDNGPIHSNYHGTHVAGNASATTNNGIGVSSAGFNCKILPVKASSDGQEYIDYGFAGVKYAIDAGADIINMSWGGGGFSSFGFDIINYANEKGVVLVASAGNYNDNARFYPAAYPHVISVAATTNYDDKANFSNYGHWIDVSAPGVSILSLDGDGTYRTSSGTSFSSPIVAGVAGLVKSQHMDWSADQISEQIRTSSDDIEPADLDYTPELGYGRVNAYSALIGSSPSIRVIDLSLSDRLGDNDGIFERGEDIELTVTLKNFLQSVDNIRIVLDENDVNITMINDEAYFARIEGTQIVDNHENPFKFHIGHVTPMGRLVEFLLKIQANEYYDWEPIYIKVAPLHADHNAGNATLTVTSIGALGYYDFVEEKTNIGNGFRFPKDNDSALFHGSFIVASDKYHVSDNCYGDDYETTWDFETAVGGEINIQTDKFGDQIGSAEFTDLHAVNSTGVAVAQNSYSYTSDPYDDFIIMEYVVKNISGELLPQIYTAIWLDWDIDGAYDNLADYDSQLNLGYIFKNLSNESNLYGMALLSPSVANSYRVIKNPVYVWPGFIDSTKFQFMTEGTKFTKSDEPDDWSHLLSAGPFSLQPNETLKIAYAILGGEDLVDLQNNTRHAQEIYGSSKDIFGTIIYYFENRGVSNSKIILNNAESTMSNDSGGFCFVNPMPGNIDMLVTKEDDIRNAISGSDAMKIMRHLAYNQQIDGAASIAADITNDGAISGSDVVALQRYLAFAPDNTGSVGEWIFTPSDTSFYFENEAEVNFTAYLLGDCTGDWGEHQSQLAAGSKYKEMNSKNGAMTAVQQTAQTQATLELPKAASGDPGTIIKAPITVTTDSTIGFAQFVVEFDSTIIALDTVLIGSDVPNFVITQINTKLPFLPTGEETNKNILVQISGGGSHTFTGSKQEVVILDFNVVDGPGEQSPLIFDKNADRTFISTSNLSDIVGEEIEFIDGNVIVTPVELTRFEGFCRKNQVHLIWETASESNNLGFNIERSSDGNTYKLLSFINGHGTTHKNKQYSYVDENLQPGVYNYRLKQFDTNGHYRYVSDLQIKVSTPLDYGLAQNYPNPFNPVTTIDYQIKEKSIVNITIYDLLGRKIKTLVNENKDAGFFKITWGNKNQNGNSVAAGIYLYQLRAKSIMTGKVFIQSKKMTLVR